MHTIFFIILCEALLVFFYSTGNLFDSIMRLATRRDWIIFSSHFISQSFLFLFSCLPCAVCLLRFFFYSVCKVNWQLGNESKKLWKRNWVYESFGDEKKKFDEKVLSSKAVAKCWKWSRGDRRLAVWKCFWVSFMHLKSFSEA